ncbi:MAG: protein-export chaperone SecB [Gammaproteobacteria bacterium]
MTDESADQAAAAGTPGQVALQRIYLKDASFEAPNSPGILRGEWKPEVTMNLSTRTDELGEGRFEVVLEISVEAKLGDNIAFLTEVQQAGMFVLQGFQPAELGQILGIFCPTQLYPYAREAIANLVGKGGFPQLHLQPVNFESMMADAQARQGDQPE